MLSIEKIKSAAQKAASHYPVRKVFLFGSYATGSADETSDVDVLVEFLTCPISLLELAGFNQELRDELNTSVDTVKLPLKKDSLIDMNQVICLYEHP
jgi:predicted nucleotidyltransferase